MRDAFIILILLFFFGAACRRPFLMTLGYLYVDIVQPQQISYYLVNSAPVSLIFGAAAVAFFALFDDKRNLTFGRLQVLGLIWLVWITFTTINAQLPDAWVKWDPASKAIIFGIFLPLVLRTRQRLEAAVIFTLLCVGSITISGGIKTIVGGGGYGSLSLLVDSNNGLYEGSTISAVAIALIPLILYTYSFNQIFPKGRMTMLVSAGLIFAAMLIPVGTEARTGLICIGVLAALLFLGAKRKILFGAAAAVIVVATLPLLPESFTGRMSTIQTYDEDSSASTRVAVWNWTWEFVKSHPFGGGFYAYKLNRIRMVLQNGDGTTRTVEDEARAFHSSYFEVLGEHGYPGLVIYVIILATAVVQTRRLYKSFRHSEEDRWISQLAKALGHTLLIYMVGSLFVGVAFQSMLYFLLAFVASLANIAALRKRTGVPAAEPVAPRVTHAARPAR